MPQSIPKKTCSKLPERTTVHFTLIAFLNWMPVVISQWAIFAIRNLLEHNMQNQELVATLERQSAADYSALRELGFLVEERDGSLLLKPVRKDS